MAVEIFDAFLLVGSVLLAAFAVAGWLGSFGPFLDIFSHLALPAAFLSIALFVLSAARARRSTWASRLFAFLACIGWVGMILPEYARLLVRTQPQDPGGISLVQFNLWSGRGNDPATIDWLRATNADLVIVQEASPQVRDGLLSDTYPFISGCEHARPCSTLILSKWAPVASGGETLPGMGSNLAWATFNTLGTEFTVVGVHFAWPDPLANQMVHVDPTAQFLQRFESHSLIVAGDFNTTPWSHAMRRQEVAFGLERLSLGVPTFPAYVWERNPIPVWLPILPIDHVYAGEDWRAIEVKRGPRLGSDHFPLLVRLKLARSSSD